MQDMSGWRLVVFSTHVGSFEKFGVVLGKIDLLACSSTEGMELDGMSNVERFLSCVGNESLPFVSAELIHIVDSSGCPDTQMFVVSDDVNASKKGRQMYDIVADMRWTDVIYKKYNITMLQFRGFHI